MTETHAAAARRPPQRDTPPAHSVAEAAARIGVSRNHLWHVIRTGALPVVRLGRRTLVTEAALRDLLRRYETVEVW